MSIAQSQFSRFGRPSNNQQQQKTYTSVNNELVPMSYDIKFIAKSLPIKIQNPQIIKTYISGDKQVVIKYFQYFNPDVETATRLNSQGLLYRIVVKNQRNNFDQTGVQTNIVGYLTYDLSKMVYQADSQPFDMDGQQDILIDLEYFNNSLQQWQSITDQFNQRQTTLQQQYIYIDLQINYENFD